MHVCGSQPQRLNTRVDSLDYTASLGHLVIAVWRRMCHVLTSLQKVIVGSTLLTAQFIAPQSNFLRANSTFPDQHCNKSPLMIT